MYIVLVVPYETFFYFILFIKLYQYNVAWACESEKRREKEEEREEEKRREKRKIVHIFSFFSYPIIKIKNF